MENNQATGEGIIFHVATHMLTVNVCVKCQNLIAGYFTGDLGDTNSLCVALPACSWMLWT